MKTQVLSSPKTLTNLLFFFLMAMANAQVPTLLRDINTSPSNSQPQNMANMGGTVYFAADDGVHGHELWKTTGASATTLLVKDINPGIND